MAELTGKTRKALPDSAFAIVRTVDGRKERKYPVHDEAQQSAALKMSHGARSGKPASPEEHRAVHAAVGRRNKTLLQEHMREHHGSAKIKKAWDGLVATLSPSKGQPEIPHMARGGVSSVPEGPYPHGKWTIVRPGQKGVGPFDDRRKATAELTRMAQQDPDVLKDAMVIQVFRAHELLADAMSDATYR